VTTSPSSTRGVQVLVLVPARNEAARLPRTLAALAVAVDAARERGFAVHVVVIAHRCTDDTAAVAAAAGVDVVRCDHGEGKVAALLAGLQATGTVGDSDVVHVVVDADVIAGPRTLRDIVVAVAEGEALAAAPPLHPEPPRRWTPLSWVLWRYNRARGFASSPPWLSGRCYAVAGLAFPDEAALRARSEAAGADDDPLLRPAHALLADDVWLSRALVARGGPGAVQHVDTDAVVFAPPATAAGMYAYFLRLTRELRRVDRLFPELPRPPPRRSAPGTLADRIAWAGFAAALAVCRLRLRVDEARARRGAALDAWPVVLEGKQP